VLLDVGHFQQLTHIRPRIGISLQAAAAAVQAEQLAETEVKLITGSAWLTLRPDCYSDAKSALVGSMLQVCMRF
jgi:hypothetical protein